MPEQVPAKDPKNGRLSGTMLELKGILGRTFQAETSTAEKITGLTLPALKNNTGEPKLQKWIGKMHRVLRAQNYESQQPQGFSQQTAK